MAYSAPTISSTGIIIPTYDDIIEYLVDKTKEIYGSDIYLDEDSMDYQFLSSFALLMYDVCQCLVLDYNSHNPDTATGTSLDRVCAYSGITRLEGTASTVLLKCTGTPGTVISYGSALDNNGYTWQMEKEFTLGEDGTAEVNASCTEDGPIQAAIGTITTIVNPTKGWESVTNEYAATIGSSVETDSHLRARREAAVSSEAVTVTQAVLSAVQNVDNVLKAKLYENPGQDIDANGIPAHSICVIAEGGTDEDVAKAIFLKKTPGCNTYGTTSVEVETEIGDTMVINFFRPIYKNVEVVVNIVEIKNYTDTVGNLIKENILNAISELDIGQTLYASDLYYPSLNAITDINNPTFYITGIKVNGGDIVTTTIYELITCDESLITIVGPTTDDDDTSTTDDDTSSEVDSGTDDSTSSSEGE